MFLWQLCLYLCITMLLLRPNQNFSIIMKHILKLITAIFSSFLVSSCALSGPSQPSIEELAAAKPYPLDTCLVIDKPLKSTKRTYIKIYKGQQVKFCCISCVKAFGSNPEYFMTKVAAAHQAES